jgi:hypothetical protein
VTLLADQDRLDDDPDVMVAGFAVIDAVGEIAVTVTTMDLDTLPEGPAQVSVYVLVAAGVTTSDPFTAFAPDQAPDAVQLEAFFVDQLSVDVEVALIVEGEAEKVICAGGAAHAAAAQSAKARGRQETGVRSIKISRMGRRESSASSERHGKVSSAEICCGAIGGGPRWVAAPMPASGCACALSPKRRGAFTASLARILVWPVLSLFWFGGCKPAGHLRSSTCDRSSNVARMTSS